jgi:monoterpene epsilon-lactone hydrolase
MLVAAAIKMAFRLFRRRHQREATEPKELRRVFARSTRRLPMSRAVTVELGDLQNMPAEWIRPKDRTRVVGAILYCHGGGYVVGNLSTHRALVAELALASHCDALLFDYRLAPEHPFPAGLDDALRAYRYLLENYRADQIVLAGDSAGGGLALALMMRLRNEGMPLPAGALLMSPYADLTFSGNSIWERADREVVIDPAFMPLWAEWYSAGHPKDHPLISPLFGDYTGLPPMLIQVGTDEVLLDDSVRVAEKARAAGVKVELEQWPGMFHVWQFFYAWLRDARTAVGKGGLFLNRCVVPKP